MKALNIAVKDILLVLHDPMGLLLMLGAPLALTLVVAFAFGGLGGGNDNSSGLSDIPVVIVSNDTGQFSSIVSDAFFSEELADLLEPVEMDHEQQARTAVDADQYAAAVIVPDGFSESILPAGVVSGDFTQRPDSGDSTVLIYANPSRPVSTNIIHSIVDTILTRISGAKAGVIVSIAQLIETERITPQEAFSQGEKLVSESSRSTDTTGKIQVSSRLIAPDTNDTGETGEFDFLRYTAPSMAILYLMFTMTNAGRSILTEREHGTLPRMLISPTSRAEVLAGKMLGVFATGLLQMTVVIVAGSYIFNMSWGHWLPLSLLTLALVAAASGWGILIAAYSKTPGQAGTVGAAVNLTFAALAGNFLPRMAYPHWMQTLSLVTPNAWGIDYYYKLIYGAQLLDVLPAILVLSGMAVLMFLLAILAFQRQVKI